MNKMLSEKEIELIDSIIEESIKRKKVVSEKELARVLQHVKSSTKSSTYTRS